MGVLHDRDDKRGQRMMRDVRELYDAIKGGIRRVEEYVYYTMMYYRGGLWILMYGSDGMLNYEWKIDTEVYVHDGRGY
jgi:hypothetical protein